MFGTTDAAGLIVVLRISKSDIDYLCGGPIQGFFVKFHNPSNDPQLWKEHYQISPGVSKKFMVEATVTTSMENIRNYNPEVRGCYYTTEKKLQFFKLYTKKNCETECLANYTLAVCECVKFSMPSEQKTYYNFE